MMVEGRMKPEAGRKTGEGGGAGRGGGGHEQRDGGRATMILLKSQQYTVIQA